MRYCLLAILLFFVQTICAQVSHQFRNTPLIDAIRTIEQGQTEYTVSILSDGLTHLTTSARIEEEDALRAIKSLCKGLGVKVKEKNGNINVQAKASLKDMPPYYFLSQVRDGFTNAKIGGVNVYLMNEDSVVLDSCKLLLSAKNQKFSNNVSAVPINRYCGFIFQKVSPPLSSKSVASGGDDPDSASIFIQSFSGHSKKEYGFT